MKRAALISLATAVFAFSACNNGPDFSLNIFYPEKSFSGLNILNEEYSVLDSNEIYALNARLEIGQPLKVVLKNTSANLPQNAQDSTTDSWYFKPNMETGWFILPYNYQTHSQTLYAEGASSPHVRIFFRGCGTLDMDIYENDTNRLAKTKSINWEEFCPR